MFLRRQRNIQNFFIGKENSCSKHCGQRPEGHGREVQGDSREAGGSEPRNVGQVEREVERVRSELHRNVWDHGEGRFSWFLSLEI